jgi:hypothetical protein
MDSGVSKFPTHHRPFAVLLALIAICGSVAAQTERDPHRPACSTAECRKIKTFLKTHYCGDSPYGNGPEDGCNIKVPHSPLNFEVVADYHCEWNGAQGTKTCKQQGQPSPEIRAILMRELRILGLPSGAKGQTYFTQWNRTPPGSTLATASYSYVEGDNLELCGVALLIDPNSAPVVLRKVKFQKTDADVPEATTWSALDMVDLNNDGKIEVVFAADAYENHWLEVVRVENGTPRTIFSGLGYYL